MNRIVDQSENIYCFVTTRVKRVAMLIVNELTDYMYLLACLSCTVVGVAIGINVCAQLI